MVIRRPLLAAAAVLVCAGTLTVQAGEVDGTWNAAYASADPATLAAVYTEDAVLMPPNAATVVGREAVLGIVGPLMASGVRLTTAPVEEIALGDYLLRRIAWKATLGETVADEGKAIEVWKKVDGEWRLHWDMFSSDRPTAQPSGTDSSAGS